MERRKTQKHVASGRIRHRGAGWSCIAAIHHLPEVRSSPYASVKGYSADGLGFGAKSSALSLMMLLIVVHVEAMIIYNHRLNRLAKLQGMSLGPGGSCKINNNCFKQEEQ